ncbi:MAG: thermonuclease family protein [Desulfobacterales bacterium]|nr:MAG: thermonuclease family protein [Desulfobacterales bacterium]
MQLLIETDILTNDEFFPSANKVTLPMRKRAMIRWIVHPKLAICLTFLLIAIPGIISAAEFKVTRVYDGDTVEVGSKGFEVSVCLVGIDAPETSQKKGQPGQPYSQQATQYLASLVLNKIVDIKRFGFDRYSRILGVIYVNGKNVNLAMLKAGLAEVNRGKPPMGLDLEPYWQAETEAKNAGYGMWGLGDKYISPRDWRSMQVK